ncbi:hypothetical protein Tco_0412997 [Tanacetum coccineum]
MDHFYKIKQVSDQRFRIVQYLTVMGSCSIYMPETSMSTMDSPRSQIYLGAVLPIRGSFLGLNATGSTINDVNSQTTSPNQNDDDQVADVPNGADYNVWLPLASVHEVNDRTKNSLYGDHMVMAVMNLEGNDYMKETIHIEYKWEPPRCSLCLIFGADDEGYIEVKKKKSGGTGSPKMTPFVDTNKASTSSYNKEPPNNKGNTFSLSNSFDALNDENLIIEEVSAGSMTTTLDDAKPPKKVDYLANLGNDDEFEPVENEMASFLASKPMSVGYGLKSLLEQWRESNEDDDYDYMIMICMNVRNF